MVFAHPTHIKLQDTVQLPVNVVKVLAQSHPTLIKLHNTVQLRVNVVEVRVLSIQPLLTELHDTKHSVQLQACLV